MRFIKFRTIEIIPSVILAIPKNLEPPFLAWNPSHTAMAAATNPTIKTGITDDLILNIPVQTHGKKNRTATIKPITPLNEALIYIFFNF